MVTSTAIASTLNKVRTGRWVRFAKISLFNTIVKSIPLHASPLPPREMTHLKSGCAYTDLAQALSTSP
jgi:hypothetical protein